MNGKNGLQPLNMNYKFIFIPINNYIQKSIIMVLLKSSKEQDKKTTWGK